MAGYESGKRLQVSSADLAKSPKEFDESSVASGALMLLE
jgi:hypothetical protein